MTIPTALQPHERGEVAISRGKALPSLPSRQGAWVGAQMATAGALGLLGISALFPNLALAAAIGAGAGVVNPKKLWGVPLAIGGATVAAALCGSLSISPVLGAGAAAGVIATWLLPHRTDALDLVNGSLGTMAGAGLGLWAATALLPASLPPLMAAMLTAGIVALVSAQGLLPTAFRFDAGPDLPTASTIKSSLRLRYRPPVLKAIDYATAASKNAPDGDTRRGLAEVATWVFRLQQTRQTLETEMDAIDPHTIQKRMDAIANQGKDVDPFTRDRRLATATHLGRLLQHRRSIETELTRTEAVVEYALAFLEEARAGLAVARELPGEAMPDRLDEVLLRLRHHADEGDARRHMSREVQRSTS